MTAMQILLFFAQVYANKTIKYVLYSLTLERNVSVNGNKQAIQAYIIVSIIFMPA